MKKIIEKLLYTFILLMAFNYASFAQKIPANTKNAKVKADTTVKKSSDSLTVMTDTTDFINNNDLITINQVMKKVMDQDEYRKADQFTQLEMLISYMNQVFLSCRARWEQKHRQKIIMQAEPEKIDIPLKQ